MARGLLLALRFTMALCLLGFTPERGWAESPVSSLRVLDNSPNSEAGRKREIALLDLPPATLNALRLGPKAGQSIEERLAVEYLRVSVFNESNTQAVIGAAVQMPAMAGEYFLRDGSLIFAPRYPFQPGITYVAHWRPSLQEGFRQHQFYIPASKAETLQPRVTQVFPTSRELPENHLRFYLHFATPMQRGEAYQHLRLTRVDGGLVPSPFLELGEEAWDRQQQRLTVLLDPGRVKQALVPRVELGPILLRDNEYELSIEPGWKDVYGHPTQESFRVRFHVGEPNTLRIEPEKWQRSRPRRRSTEPLTVTFPVTMDNWLAQHAIVIVDQHGQAVEGRVKLENGERTWIFEPDKLWGDDHYRLRVAAHLEDTAGNNLRGPLETVLGLQSSPTAKQPWIDRAKDDSSDQKMSDSLSLPLLFAP